MVTDEFFKQRQLQVWFGFLLFVSFYRFILLWEMILGHVHISQL